MMDFKQLQKHLDMNDASMAASELHGCLWGLYCGESDRSKINWRQSLASLLDEETQSLSVDLVNCIETIKTNICQQLDDGLFEAPLMLPADEEPLNVRLEGLVNWCEGWLLGFGMSHQHQVKLSNDGQEALVDIRDISHVDTSIHEEIDEDEHEDMEKDFNQLCEHVKIATQLIQSDITFAKMTKTNVQNSKSIH